MKAVIMGCGARGKDHLEAYLRISGLTVSACFDPDPKRCRIFAETFKIKPYEDASQMLAAESPEIVSVTTFPDVRLELMQLVSAARVPLCLVEKPLASGVHDWRTMCELEAKSETKFGVNHQVRWHKDLKRCAESVNSGRLGQVLFLDLSAGMNLSGQGTHTLNYGMLLNGDSPVKTVFGNMQGWDSKDKRHPAPIASEAMLTFENGARALWTSGPVSPLAGSPDHFWQHVRVAAYAERGRVNYEEFGDWQIMEGSKIETGNFGGMDEWNRNNGDSQTRLIEAMLEWGRHSSKRPGTHLKQSLHEWAVVLALYQSSLTGNPVDLRDFNPNDDLIEVYQSKRAP